MWSTMDLKSGELIQYAPVSGHPAPRQVAEAENATAFRELLIDFCGPLYNELNMPDTCCDFTQLQTLKASLQAAQSFMYSCQACWENFKVRRRVQDAPCLDRSRWISATQLTSLLCACPALRTRPFC